MKKAIYICALISLIFISQFYTESPSVAALGGNDIQDIVEISDIIVSRKINDTEWEVLIKDGEAVSNTVNEIGETIKFELTWFVDNNLGTLEENDYFDISLPAQYFTFKSTEPVDLYDGNTGNVLGTYQIIAGVSGEPAYIRVIMNEYATSKISFRGYTFAMGLVHDGKEASDLWSIGGVSLPPIQIQQPLFDEMTEESVISKEGVQIGQTNQIEWSMMINHNEYQALYNGAALANTKENVLFIDHLEDGMVFDELKIEIPYYAPASNGKMSSSVLFKQTISLSAFAELKQTEADTLDDFIARIENYDGLAYGIYHDADNLDHVVISLESLPYQNEEILWSLATVLERIDYAFDTNLISLSQKNKMIQAYQAVYGASQDYSWIGLKISIISQVTKGEGTYTNTGYLYWGNGESAESENFVVFDDYGAGVITESFHKATLHKSDGETNAPLEGVGFKLQIMNKEQWIDVVDNQGETIHYTDSEGIAEFSRLKQGQYRWVEIDSLEGYSERMIFTEGTSEFTIDQYSEINLTFSVNNLPTISISGTKTWNDEDNRYGRRPETITIHLYAGGVLTDIQPVWVKNENVWTYSFMNLEKYDEQKSPIIYTVDEVPVNGYTKSQIDYDFVNTLDSSVLPDTGSMKDFLPFNLVIIGGLLMALNQLSDKKNKSNR